jgi:hypothetical protein
LNPVRIEVLAMNGLRPEQQIVERHFVERRSLGGSPGLALIQRNSRCTLFVVGRERHILPITSAVDCRIGILAYLSHWAWIAQPWGGSMISAREAAV